MRKVIRNGVTVHDPQIPVEDFEIKTRKPKILLWDIETAPIYGTVWQKCDTNLIWIVKDWHMISWSAKWLDGKQTTKALPDYEGYEKDPTDDKALITELWHLLEQADVIVAHNGDRFDTKKANARFLFHGLPPPQPRASVDTCKVAKRYFANTSNKLDDLGKLLKVGQKVKTGGHELWRDCVERRDQKAWNKMKRYNAQDVRLLEAVYLKLRPWITNHPNMAILRSEEYGCRNCGSRKLQARGFAATSTGKRQRYQCQDCGAWMQGKHDPILEVR